MLHHVARNAGLGETASKKMFGGFDFGRLNPVPLRFDEQYRCYPVSFCDKSHLEDGDKILLPPSALEMLARMDIAYPMLFQLENESMGRKTHCGVLEFSAQEGSCYMPYWVRRGTFLSRKGFTIGVR